MRFGLALIALIALVACQPPQARLARSGYALEVVFQEAPEELPDPARADLQAAYENAIRAKLAAAYGAPAPSTGDVPLIQVEVDEIRPAAFPKQNLFAGWAMDSAISGLLDHITANPDGDAHQTAINDSYLDRAIDRTLMEHRLNRLGYLPMLVSAHLRYEDGRREYRCVLQGEKLLAAYRPLPELGGREPSQIRAEEGRVLAEAVAQRLASRADWVVVIKR